MKTSTIKVTLAVAKWVALSLWVGGVLVTAWGTAAGIIPVWAGASAVLSLCVLAGTLWGDDDEDD